MQEPNFFTNCNLDGNCQSSGIREEDYIENVLRYSEAEGSGFQRSTFEASVNYTQADSIRIRKMVPGVKIVASLRGVTKFNSKFLHALLKFNTLKHMCYIAATANAEPISRMISLMNHIKRNRHVDTCGDGSPYDCMKMLLQGDVK